jgi:hypothetical protein
MKAVVVPTRAAKRAVFDARRRQPSVRYHSIFNGDAVEVDICEGAIQEMNLSEVGAPERAADKDTVCNRHASQSELATKQRSLCRFQIRTLEYSALKPSTRPMLGLK